MTDIKGFLHYRAVQIESLRTILKNKLGRADTHDPDGLIDAYAFADWLKGRIKSGEPFMAARYGGEEARATVWAIGVARHYSLRVPKYVQRRMSIGPGFFPCDSSHIVEFGKVMVEASSQLDSLAYWCGGMQKYLLEEVCPDILVVTRLASMEPYYYLDNPWSSALAGKKVLVVHPFATTIESQYRKRGELFSNPDVLPAFKLQTLVPPQTIAGTRDKRFLDWFEAFDYLKNQVDGRDFDTAIIGCGAYGFPLAAHVKATGRQAIHLGGATQVLFGIKGRRWDSNPYFRDVLYNSAWVRAGDKETPANAKKVENGCYW